MSAQLTDRELLEFAAKACGWVYSWLHNGYNQTSSLRVCYSSNPMEGTRFDKMDWNPLTDDGDAMRLAVEMRMTIDVHLWRDEVQVRAYDKLRGGMYHVDESGETGAATRRAVVRAAAEIGKAMP